MAVSYQIILASISIFASIIALYVLIIASFQKKERPATTEHSNQRRTRIITASAIRQKIKQIKRKTNTRVTSMIWTVLIGQGMGIYLLLTYVESSKILVGRILKINGGLLLLASLLCSVLTLLNGWLKKKMVIAFRLAFQTYSFIIAMILLMFRMKGGHGARTTIFARIMPEFVIYFFLLTVVVALAMMLWDALYRKHLHISYDYSKYYRLVVLIGMILGLGAIIGLRIMKQG